MERLLNKLKQAGAVLDEHGVVQRFAEPEREARFATAGEAVALLNGLAVVRVSGADAQSFLAAQLSSDVAGLDLQHVQLSSWCSPQGRVLSAPWLVPQKTEQWLLIVPCDLAEQLVRRMKMFVLRANASVDLADNLALLGVAGDAADIVPQPTETFALLSADGLSVARIPGDKPRYLCVVEVDSSEALWARLSAILHPIGESAWRLLDIRAGLPRIDSHNTDQYLPQMLNLTAFGAVSFTKGCFPGQEIIARLKYRGTLKRRLYLASYAGNASPAPGQRITLGDEPDRAVGEVIDAQRLADRWYLTAVIDIAATQSAALTLHDAGPIDLLDLPYTPD